MQTNQQRKQGQKSPNLPIFCCDDTAVFTVSHTPWKTKLTISPILLLTTVALKIKSVLTITLTEETRGLRTSLLPLADSRRGMKRLTCSAKLCFSLSLDSSLADKNLQERKEKNECADICQVSVSLWFFFWKFPSRGGRGAPAQSKERK